MARDSTVGAGWRALRQAFPAPVPAAFSSEDLDHAPEPVRRYFRHAIGDGSPRSPAAELRMRGHIKIGPWLPFRARQLLAPRIGTVWAAQVGPKIITGSDQYLLGQGAMDWRLFGLLPIMRASGPDISRSAAGRVAGESVWVPTALAPPSEASWTASSEHEITVEVPVDKHHIAVTHQIDDNGRLLRSHFDRWGDPDRTGVFALHPFGLEATGWGSFDGISIPTAGQVGWHHHTERWDEGLFFRFEITAYRLVTAAPSA